MTSCKACIWKPSGNTQWKAWENGFRWRHHGLWWLARSFLPDLSRSDGKFLVRLVRLGITMGIPFILGSRSLDFVGMPWALHRQAIKTLRAGSTDGFRALAWSPDCSRLVAGGPGGPGRADKGWSIHGTAARKTNQRNQQPGDAAKLHLEASQIGSVCQPKVDKSPSISFFWYFVCWEVHFKFKL